MPDLLADLEAGLRDAATALPPNLADMAAAAAGQLRDYIRPRLRDAGAPLVAVVGGSTGAGKSTLVNSLLGRSVSAVSAIRPTTRAPALVFNPVDEAWFAAERILPTLQRVRAGEPFAPERAQQMLVLIPDESIPAGLALIDAPDIDSIVEANRELGRQLLAAADLWLFVTTPSRYADAVAWDLLVSAAARNAAVAIVLNRATSDEVEADLRRLLAEAGLGDALVFATGDGLAGDGLIPDVGPIRAWLSGLAADAAARAQIARQTVSGALEHVLQLSDDVVAAYRERLRILTKLHEAADHGREHSVADLGRATKDGSILRGEVLARWQEFVATGGLFKDLEARMGQIRDRLWAMLRGKPAPSAPVEKALASRLQSLLVEEGEQLIDHVRTAWTALGQPDLIGPGERLATIAPDFAATAANELAQWRTDVVNLVKTEGAAKRSTARVLAYGVNALGVSLMIAIFASTGALTGAEVGVAGGTAVVSQKLLEAIFGDDAVRRLAARGRALLMERAEKLFAGLSAVLAGRTQVLGLDPRVPDRIAQAAAEVGQSR